jgi:hypothetical protein
VDLVWCGADVVDGIVTNLVLNSSGTSEVRKLGENAVHWCTETDDFDEDVISK